MKDFYGFRQPKRGRTGGRPGGNGDTKTEVSAAMPTAAPDRTDMRSDRTYPGVAADRIYGKDVFTRTSSKYGVGGPDNHGRTNGMGKK